MNPADITLSVRGLGWLQQREASSFDSDPDAGAESPWGAWHTDVSIGFASHVDGRIFAPNGSVRVHSFSTLRADISAKHVFYGKAVSIDPAGEPFRLDDVNQCTQDTCEFGIAVHTPIPDGIACDDANLCTRTDLCRDGICVGSNAVVCTSAEPCKMATCAPTTGLCEDAAKPDGSACNDGDVCSLGDECRGGACIRGKAEQSCPQEACRQIAICDAVAGCRQAPLLPGVSCAGTDLQGATCDSATHGERPLGYPTCVDCQLDTGGCSWSRLIVECTSPRPGNVVRRVYENGTETYSAGGGLVYQQQITPDALTSLLTSAEAMESSTLGYTTVPEPHNTPHSELLYVYGPSRRKILVTMLDAGAGPGGPSGSRTTSNDSAATEIRKYGCGGY